MKDRRNRPLVLRDEGIRHPFRQTLPPAILAAARRETALAAEPEPKKLISNEDVSLFLLSFTAFFLAFYLFIF